MNVRKTESHDHFLLLLLLQTLHSLLARCSLREQEETGAKNSHYGYMAALELTCLCVVRNTTTDLANQNQRRLSLVSEVSNWPFLDPQNFQVE